MKALTSLYVPLPTGNFGRNYGVHSTRHASAERVTLRITADHRELIQRAAKVLDMSEAQFIRETATNAAKALFQQIEEHNGHDDGSGSG